MNWSSGLSSVVFQRRRLTINVVLTPPKHAPLQPGRLIKLALLPKGVCTGWCLNQTTFSVSWISASETPISVSVLLCSCFIHYKKKKRLNVFQRLCLAQGHQAICLLRNKWSALAWRTCALSEQSHIDCRLVGENSFVTEWPISKPKEPPNHKKLFRTVENHLVFIIPLTPVCSGTEGSFLVCMVSVVCLFYLETHLLPLL